MKINDLSDTSKDVLTDFTLAAMMGTSFQDGEVADEEIGLFWTYIKETRDYLKADHPALPIAERLNRRALSSDTHIQNLPAAHDMLDRVHTVLESVDEGDERDLYAWLVMHLCHGIAKIDGNVDLSEQMYIVDLFRNLGWDYAEYIQELGNED